MTTPPLRALYLLALFISIGVYFVVVSAGPGGIVAFDIYSYQYPNVVYALHRLQAGGSGLLWNPFQNCGEPFFGISSTSFLYPANLFYLFLDGNTATYAVWVFNMLVAGAGGYFLGRELGFGFAGALSTALAFELGNSVIDLNTWSPMMGSPYVWTAAMLACCERILRAPSRRATLALALVTTLALSPGSPQPVVYAYALIAARALWELIVRREARRGAVLIALGLGLLLPVLLLAVHLLPGIEMTGLSVRKPPLSLAEIEAHGFLTWGHFRKMFTWRNDLFSPLIVLPAIIAAAALSRRETRRAALLYLTAGTVAFILSFGPATPLFDWYLALPLARTFREPARFQWVTSFCLAVLAGCGVDAIARPGSSAGWARAARLALGPTTATFAFHLLSVSGLRALERIFAGAVITAVFVAGMSARRLAWPALVALMAIAINVVGFPNILFPKSLNAWILRPLPLRRVKLDMHELFIHAPMFESLRRMMTAQDRIYLAYKHPSFTLMAKTAQLFEVPAIQDYEPQPTRRSAEYSIMLRNGTIMRDLNAYYYMGARMLPVARRRLLDLAAARYVVTDRATDRTAGMRPPPELRWRSWDDTVRVYENAQAFPRAYYVPKLQVIPDAGVLLRRLAEGTDDLRQSAFVEAAPPSGYYGGGTGSGAVEFVTNEPEHVVLRVEATDRGFVHLTDQYYPGWYATVNGVATPIQRANFLFRLVEVGAGESTVEFRFRPASLRIGAVVSAFTLVVVAISGVVSGRWRRRAQDQD